jgi:UPF0755 protein
MVVKKNLVWIVVALVLLVAGSVSAWFAYGLSAPDGTQGDVTVVVSRGSRVRDIAARLHEARLVRSELAFRAYVVLRGLNANLQAGTYRFRAPLTIPELVTQLASGELKNEARLTVLEGWTMEEIGAALARAELMTAEQFLAAAKSHDSREILPERSFSFLSGRPAQATLEGFLFPDTYFVSTTATPAQIIEKMLDNFDKKLTPDLREGIVRSGRSIFETVTLASIVEKEVRTDRDRALVADLFLRRLKIGMALQSDATVNYVTGKSLRQPTFEDTRVDSLYNTYLHRGLPPGPIGNPSLSSIKAVIFPVANDNFYYLNAPDGTTIFSKTYAEHLANKAKYLP